jgi:hypothetical protein
MKVDLQYFKRNGKYYGGCTYEVPDHMVYHQLIEHIRDLASKRQLPNLRVGHSRFVVLVSDHNGLVPHLINLEDEDEQDG